MSLCGRLNFILFKEFNLERAMIIFNLSGLKGKYMSKKYKFFTYKKNINFLLIINSN
jgi:hypothetical protein